MKHVHDLKERLICELKTKCAEMSCEDEIEEGDIHFLRGIAKTVLVLNEVCGIMNPHYHDGLRPPDHQALDGPMAVKR